jgi:hypothetical protein
MKDMLNMLLKINNPTPHRPTNLLNIGAWEKMADKLIELLGGGAV